MVGGGGKVAVLYNSNRSLESKINKCVCNLQLHQNHQIPSNKFNERCIIPLVKTMKCCFGKLKETYIMFMDGMVPQTHKFSIISVNLSRSFLEKLTSRFWN